FREAGWVGQSGRIEERMPLVDALVDDRDLHAVPCGRERRAPERRRADQPRGAVERGVVRDAWPDPGDAADPREPGAVSCRREGDDQDGRSYETPFQTRNGTWQTVELRGQPSRASWHGVGTVAWRQPLQVGLRPRLEAATNRVRKQAETGKARLRGSPVLR